MHSIELSNPETDKARDIPQIQGLPQHAINLHQDEHHPKYI